MKFKLISIPIMLAIIFSACSDESLPGTSLESSEKYVTSRSGNDLVIEYDLTSESFIKPIEGTIQDMCPADLLMLTRPITSFHVSTSISPEGSVCILMDNTTPEGNPEDPINNGEGGPPVTSENEIESVEFCNGQLIITSADTTITTTSNTSLELFKSIYISHLQSDEEKKAAFKDMIQEAIQNGATVERNANTISLTITNEDGSTSTNLFDKNNMVLLSTIETDIDGGLTSRTSYSYLCNADGDLVPAVVVTTKTDGTSSICATPYVSTIQQTFDNYSLNI